MTAALRKLSVLLIATSMMACAGLHPKRQLETANVSKPNTSNTSAISTDSKALTQTSVEPQGLHETAATPPPTPLADEKPLEPQQQEPSRDVATEAPHGGASTESHETAHSAQPEVKLVPAAHSEHKGDAHGGGHKNDHHAVDGVAPEKALSWLKNGNTRFTNQKLRKDGQGPSDIKRLSSGQQPHSIVLSCSDSRVPPEVLFDQKLGEIFVVRTAGQSLDDMAIASMEYAVSHLGSKLIVVMGHESCGAVKAAHGTFGGKDAGSPALNHLVADIQPRIKKFENKTLSKGALLEGWANVTGVAKDLLERSSIIREAVQSGQVRIEQALYHLGDGHVEWKE